ncbi:hypothetical protein GY12_21920 [Micrococcus luteus]|nr:hypothetical protein GY12_21920 [Micrococcus luteus]
MDIVLYEEDFDFDAASEQAIEENNQVRTMVGTLTNWLMEQEDRQQSASRRLHLHFLQAPEEFLDEDGDGRVDGLRMRRMELDGSGGVRPTGETVDYPVQAVYRAVGYFGSPVEGVEFDEVRGVIPNAEGRGAGRGRRPGAGVCMPRGWIKRGPGGG